MAMGSIKQEGGRLETQWWVIDKPYKQANVKHLSLPEGEKPEGARVVDNIDSAKRSIQQIMGVPPEKITLDIGIMDATIREPSPEPGREGAITFERDIGQKTRGDIVLAKKKKVTKTKRKKRKKSKESRSIKEVKKSDYGTIEGWFGK